jgi:hypothetical protein
MSVVNLEEVEPPESVPGGEAGAGGSIAGTMGGVGAWAGAGVAGVANVGLGGCSLGIEVQLY